jgi:hypothetical protein
MCSSYSRGSWSSRCGPLMSVIISSRAAGAEERGTGGDATSAPVGVESLRSEPPWF